MKIPDEIRNKMFERPLSPGLWKTSTEYTALALLKFCEGEPYRFMRHADAPDLQDLNRNVGIEVTEAITKEQAQVNGEFVKLSESNDPNEKDKSRQIILDRGVDLPDDWMMVFPPVSAADEKHIVLNAFESKLDKATVYRRKGFSQLGLFIYIEKPIFNDTRAYGYKWLSSAQADRTDKYDFVYLGYRDGLLLFDFTIKKCKDYHIPTMDMVSLQHLGRMTAEGEIKDDDPIWTS